MVLAYHVIFSAYGFWLPNDPRGSWSEVVRAWELLKFGEATKVETRRSVAMRAHDWELRAAAKRALRYAPVVLDGRQCLAIGHGFREAIYRSGMRMYACAILPEHVHVVVGRHRLTVEKMRQRLKGAASRALMEEGVHPFGHFRLKSGRVHSPWGDEGWDVYLDSEEDVARAVRYVEGNPGKEGKPRQRWSFVEGYRGGGG